MTNDRLLEVLDDWAKWMRRPGSKLGYPTKSAFLSSGGGSSANAYQEMLSESNFKNVLKIDALITSLPKDQRESINAKYLGSKEPSNHYDNLAMAMDNLLNWADRRMIV